MTPVMVALKLTDRAAAFSVTYFVTFFAGRVEICLRKIIRCNGICAYHYFIVFWTAWMFFQFLIFLTCKNIQFCSTVTSLYPVLNSGRQLMTVLTHHEARMLSRSHILYTDLGPKQAFKGRVDNFNINMVYPKV